MKSFEEEMGSFNTEKAYLQEEEFAFAINPGEKEKTETKAKEEEKVLEINPFSSFLSAEDAKAVEQITNFTVEPQKVKPAAEKTAAEKTSAETASEKVSA